ncbi:hypothetical protein F53441_13376 [Fusarium austroafricanum]|uniref:AMP-dependent synthetase/ligase domain-containing protein n=1 Tax=Fusarium austroafricanum TaxID=2364996 RepID=A0A8H4NK19_9HYPO|nr:hypothetical protein F53441_13376 [Fusarium austroafricanum]
MRTYYTFFTIIEAIAKSWGEAPAIRFLESDSTSTYKTISYAEYWNDIENAAKSWVSVLSEAGIAKGAVVGVWMKGWSYDDLLHFLGLQRAGFIPQMFSLRMTDMSIVNELLVKSKAACLIYDSSCESLVKDCLLPIFHIENVLDGPSPQDIRLDKVTGALRGDKVMIILHTSGSTSGMPKLVPTTVKWLDCLFRRHKLVYMDNPHGVYAFMGSFTHLGNTINLVEALANGGCLIAPRSIPYPASELQNMIAEGGLTALSTFPVLLSSFLKEARTNETLLKQLQSLHHIFHAGADLEPSDEVWAREQGIRLINGYGSTEIGWFMRSDEVSPYLVPFPENPCEFVPLGEGSDQLLELVIPPEADNCPDSSLLKEDGKFHTGDLFQRVGTDQYLYKGRVDDRIKMQLALVCDAGSLEAEAMQVCEADLISAVSIIGTGRPSPSMVVEPKNYDTLQISEKKMSDFKKEIVRRIEPFHKRKYLHERITEPRFIFVVPQGTLPRTPKGNIQRKAVEMMFFDEMEKASSA